MKKSKYSKAMAGRIRQLCQGQHLRQRQIPSSPQVPRNEWSLGLWGFAPSHTFAARGSQHDSPYGRVEFYFVIYSKRMSLGFLFSLKYFNQSTDLIMKMDSRCRRIPSVGVVHFITPVPGHHQSCAVHDGDRLRPSLTQLSAATLVPWRNPIKYSEKHCDFRRSAWSQGCHSKKVQKAYRVCCRARLPVFAIDSQKRAVASSLLPVWCIIRN